MATVNIFCSLPNGIIIAEAGPDAPKLVNGSNVVDADLWAAALQNPTIQALIASGEILENS